MEKRRYKVSPVYLRLTPADHKILKRRALDLDIKVQTLLEQILEPHLERWRAQEERAA